MMVHDQDSDEMLNTIVSKLCQSAIDFKQCSEMWSEAFMSRDHG